MDIARKLELLADAAKYDVACTSSGVNRSGKKGQLGSATQAGCCHSFTPDGRCVTLLKVLMTNVCTCDCAYCVNRVSNRSIERTAFTPRELADLTIGFYRRNFIEGLFLSSGVAGNPDNTTELMIRALEILRHEYGFRGYIHAKAIPGASPELLQQLGFLCDRLSVNMELPSAASLALLAPDKTKTNILAPMRQICDNCAEDAESRALSRRTAGPLAQRKTKTAARAFAPAGQSTQMIIGASPESDHHILNLSASLYRTLSLKRVFFSAYVPVTRDPRLPQTDRVPLNREHRLYQADWLMRFYEFSVDEIIDEADPFLDLEVDPKAAWALRHLDLFPVEVNTASYEVLLRVPGIGVRGAKLILRARRHSTLGADELRKLGIAWKRARYFVTCKGAYAVPGADFSAPWLRAQLAAPIDGGAHGRRSAKEVPGQLSLFDGLDAQTGHVQPKMPAAPSPLPQGRGGEELLLAGGGPAALPLQERRTGAQRRLEPKSGAVPGNGARPGAGRSAPRPQTAPRAFAALKPAVEALF
ncbi:putative DNA modification/repair radical SAM protein [Parvibacter caecicola]|uniref:putative DNA modification/repair radical SAM protein n=1 Tax=Parvibacter caecicola TaxID=747645 RepID=UPI00249C3501|nr:putative DNA modification/repair radical SAM protein [Parvibacter caecicola]